MFILNPDQYLLPVYRISPFRTADIAFNQNLPDDNRIDDYFISRFQESSYVYTFNGREALNIALSHYKLNPYDVVTILTTSGNLYISKCVTSEVEKFCSWSRLISPETKVLLVIHEFGYPYHDLKRLKEENIPIIEDCASSFFSDDFGNQIGNIGDFVVYSFPKMFPIQIGGLLLSHRNDFTICHWKHESEMLRYIKNVMSHYINTKDIIIKKRKDHYKELAAKFNTLGLHERFEMNKRVVPGAFMFSAGQNINLSELKEHFWAHGIHSSVFYGEKAFFIPVHQALMPQDLEYFFEVMKAFLNNQKA